jgi:membrane protease subunit HflK
VDDRNFYVQTVSAQAIIKRLIIVVPLLIVLFLATTSYYTVPTDSKGVVLRFGKFNRTTNPGLHFKLPMGIETVYKPQVTRIFKEEFGMKTLEAGVKTRYGKKNLNESLMLCGDLSVAEVDWIVQYKIKDAREFLFNVRNPQQVIRDVSESVMRSVVGDSSVDEVLTTRKTEINDEAMQAMQEILNKYEAGIEIVMVKLQDVNPPEEVRAAFNEVNSAQQDKQRMKREAEEQYNKVIPKARGEASQMIKQAQAYAIDRTNTATGDADRFNQILKEYTLSKSVTRKRMYLESMDRIMPGIDKKIIVDEEVKSILPMMNIGETK